MFSTPAYLYAELSSCKSFQSQTRQHFNSISHDALTSLALVQLFNGTAATGATLGLCIFEFVTDSTKGPEVLPFLSLLRFLILLGVGFVAYKAFGTYDHSFLGIQRPTLCRVALYLQLLWFTSELILGSALLVFFPLIQGSELGSPLPPPSPTLLHKLLPVLYMLSMTGCLCFFTQISNKRQGKGMRGLFSFATSTSSSSGKASAEGGNRKFAVAADGVSCRPPPPTVTCEIVLLEHQLDTNECVLFVHKKLRPIKTRLESPNYPAMLRPLVNKTQQHQQQQPSQQQQQPRQQQQAATQGGPQPARPAPPPPPQLPINLSSAAAQLSQSQQAQQGTAPCQVAAAASGGGCGFGVQSSQGSFTSPLQRLQRLASGNSSAGGGDGCLQRQGLVVLGGGGGGSFTSSTCSISFTAGHSHPGFSLGSLAHRQGHAADEEVAGMVSVQGRGDHSSGARSITGVAM